MRVWAYCTFAAREAVRLATGVDPHTSPPIVAATLMLQEAQGCDLLYIRLHGLPEFPSMWFGEDVDGDMTPALDVQNLTGVDLTGSVVLLANCYGSTSPLVPEFYEAGAEAVIAGPGPNMAAGRRVIGTDKLAQYVIAGLRRRWGPERALRFARLRLVPSAWRIADRDALEFSIMPRRFEHA